MKFFLETEIRNVFGLIYTVGIRVFSVLRLTCFSHEIAKLSKAYLPTNLLFSGVSKCAFIQEALIEFQPEFTLLQYQNWSRILEVLTVSRVEIQEPGINNGKVWSLVLNKNKYACSLT